MIKLLSLKLWRCLLWTHHKPPIPFDAEAEAGDETTCCSCNNRIVLGQDGYWQLAWER